MKHLPATIKQLLKLRNPNPPPPTPIPTLNAILKSTLLDAKQKDAETAWLVLTVRNRGFRALDGLSSRAQTCTLLTANLPTSVGHLYSFATRKDPADVSTRRGLERAVNTAALMRESAFKSTIFVGVPRVSPDQARGGVYDFIVSFWGSRVSVLFFSALFQVILSLAELTNALEDDVKEHLPKSVARFVFHPISRRVLWGT